MATQFTPEQLELLQHIRGSIAGKAASAPLQLSAAEFDRWRQSHAGFFLRSGYLSVWDGINVPPGTGEIVIEKKGAREGTKPYLVFRDEEMLGACCRNMNILGRTAYRLMEDRFSERVRRDAQSYGVTDSACIALQSELEKFVGMHFMADVSAISDEALYASLYQYFKRAVPSKEESVFRRFQSETPIDIRQRDARHPIRELAGSSYDTTFSHDEDVKESDPASLYRKIVDMLDKLKDQKDSKYDMKDRLLGPVALSTAAANAFLSQYYACLREREAVWRPIALAGQVCYVHDQGEKYLKNPAFVRACGDMTLGDMLERQIDVCREAGISSRAVNNMYAFAERVREENSWDRLLSKCACSTEQIGKALSKELREEETCCALAKGLLVLHMGEGAIHDASDRKGEYCHE